jgi:hypothetical protein
VPNQPPPPVPVQVAAWESEQPAPSAPAGPTGQPVGYLEPAADEADEVADEVAADLAALLWQNVDDQPHNRNVS